MADEYEDHTDFQSVLLVDRTGRGGAIRLASGVLPGEIQFNNRFIRITAAPFPVPVAVARFIFSGRNTQQMVHTADGQFLRRLGIQDCPEWLVAELGPDAADTDPITIDPDRPEGWDSETADPERASARVLTVRTPRADQAERQGPSGPATFGGRRT
jgi:hypothetical protein